MGQPKDKRQIVILITGCAAVWVGVAIWTMPGPVLLGFFAAILLLLLLARILLAIDNRKYQRLAEQKCLNCGYDLRQSTQRCPECGAFFGLGWGGILDE